MPRWARAFTLVVGMTAWAAMVTGSLLLRETPPAVIVGFPPALWIALVGRDKEDDS